MPTKWDACIAEGNKSFTYMINNLDDMFDKDSIKHFDIRYATSDCIIYYNNIRDKYLNTIQHTLIQWIYNEHTCGRLYEQTNWKPFRDVNDYTEMYLGYKKLFLYKEYYFQLAIEYRCECDECIYCITEKNRIHFELGLYGWRNNCNNLLDPDKRYSIELDDIICRKFWERE